MPPLPAPRWTAADAAALLGKSADAVEAAFAARGVWFDRTTNRLVRRVPDVSAAAPAPQKGGRHEPAPAADCPPLPRNAPAGPGDDSLSRPNAPAVPARPSALPASVRAAAASRAEKAATAGGLLPHVIVRARAGTGKTTTLVCGVQRLLGTDPVDAKGRPVAPSPQQAAVWDALAGPAGTPRPGSVGFVAFNKSIADELGRRLPAGCDACTMHSLGFAAVRRAFPGVRVEQHRVDDFVLEAVGGGREPREVRKEHGALMAAVRRLVGLCKMNLTGFREGGYGPPTDADLDALASHYEVELEDERAGKDVRGEAFRLVPEVLARCLDASADNRVDYDDMVWLPVALGLPVRGYDVLLWDEQQDGNRCQQALARKAGRRLVLCGDDRQAIYGFLGADSAGMDRMYRELVRDPKTQVPCAGCNGEGIVCGNGVDFEPCACSHCGGSGKVGCVVLPLTVTRRCGRAIVDEARKIVPDFEAHPDNGPGRVERLAGNFPKGGAAVPKDRDYRDRVEDGDMVLCRCNAPLVSECFRFLRAGRKATIQGRDVGAGLVALVRRLAGKAGDALPVPDLVARLGEYRRREEEAESRKRTPSEAKLIALGDKVDCLLCFAEGAAAAGDVARKIEDVFTADPNAPGIRLSSIHRSKGLESEAVYILEPEKAPIDHPMTKTDWGREQNKNLRYVATTRAIKTLTYVS